MSSLETTAEAAASPPDLDCSALPVALRL
ncbi:hypothetical protein L602_005900000100, partial [Cupriavidus gilardii J11]